MTRFSVVTISFNQARFLERAIRSVIAQAGVELDYVVVDPGSTDGSRDIIARYADRIGTVILDPDQGAADGLNKGLAACTGELFAFINADDELLPDALAEAAALFARHPQVDVLCGESWQVDEADRVIRRLVGSRRITAWLCARQAVIVVQQSAFMRIAAIRAVGGFDAANRTSWDGELYYRLAAAGARFRRVGRLWARFRVHGGSITGSGTLAGRYQADARAVFEREFGRPRRAIDPLLGRLALGWEMLRDPYLLRAKLAGRLRRSHG